MHQYYWNQLGTPNWWWGRHHFSGNACYGLHVELKPFFEHLNVPLGDHAYQQAEEKKEEDDSNDEQDGDD
jgi:hypothetical protein